MNMVKFEGFDKNGKIKVSDCKTHHYADLPMKGLGKSMEGVGIDEPVIISQSAGFDQTISDYTRAEIERRAEELDADVKWKEMMRQKSYDEPMFQMWFCNGRQLREQTLKTTKNKQT